jgi:hypothetical protein
MNMDKQFNSLCDNISNIVTKYQVCIHPVDCEYITDWLAAIRLAYDIGYFELPIEVRKNVPWNEYSFVRSDWGNALVGFRSEVVALISHVHCGVVSSECRLSPSDKELQVAGTDIIIEYTGKRQYSVSVQVKTSTFTPNSKIIHINSDWLKYKKTHKYHRIYVVDTELRAIIKSDYDDFIKNCYLADNCWILEVDKLTSRTNTIAQLTI